MRVLVLDTDPWGKLGIVRALGRVNGIIAITERELADGTWSKSGAAVILVSEKAVQNKQRSLATIKRKFPHANILVLGDSDDATAIEELVRDGADGYFKMSNGEAELVNAINVVARGAFFLPGNAARAVVSKMRSTPLTAEALSDAERNMLTLLKKGLTNKQIAESTGESEASVKTRIRQLCRRFRVRTRVHVLMHAIRKGLLTRD